MKELLKWFFDFAYLKLDELSGVDALAGKYVQEYMNIILRGSVFPSTGPWAMDLKSLTETQSAFLSAFGPIMKKVKDIQESKPARRKWQTLKEGFHRIDDDDPWSELSRVYLLPHSFVVRLELRPFVSIPLEHKEFQARPKRSWQDESTIQLITDPLEREHDIFLMRFLEALNGVRLQDLAECEECGKWFLKTSKHERRFCSKLCAIKRNSREKREQVKEKGGKKYAAMLEAGARRARKSYERRTGEKSWGKPRRNPRKYE